MTSDSRTYEPGGERAIEPGSSGERDCLERTGHALEADGLCACGKSRGVGSGRYPSTDNERTIEP